MLNNINKLNKSLFNLFMNLLYFEHLKYERLILPIKKVLDLLNKLRLNNSANLL